MCFVLLLGDVTTPDLREIEGHGSKIGGILSNAGPVEL